MMMTEDLIRKAYANSLHTFVQRAFGELNPGDTFVAGLYLRALCNILERIESGELRRVIIALGPRHLKSQIASVSFPAWLLARDPTTKIVCASYSSALAEDFGRQTRNLMRSGFYQKAFPWAQLDPGKSSVDEFHTTKKGRRIATSVGGTLTGKGGNLLIIDDPMKAEDAQSLVKRDSCYNWYSNTAASRLNDPRTGAVLIVAQRLHVDDLIGRLSATGNWDVFSLPAIATERQVFELGDGALWHREIGELLHPERIDQVQLDRIRQELGSAAFEAQYQQSPTLPGGNLVKREWFGTYEGKPGEIQYEAIVQSWDTAAVPGIGNDYAVCTTWGLINNSIDLLDVYRGQFHFADMLRAARKLREKWKPQLIVVEKAHVGIAMGTELQRDGLKDVQALSVKDDKVTRMSLQNAKIEAGQVRLPKIALWLDTFLAEVADFPNGTYDDQVDTMSQILAALDRQPYQIRTISRYKPK